MVAWGLWGRIVKGYQEAFEVDGEVHFLKLGEVFMGEDFKLNTMNICSLLYINMILVKTGERKSRREGGSKPASLRQKLEQFSGFSVDPLTCFSSPGRWGHK